MQNRKGIKVRDRDSVFLTMTETEEIRQIKPAPEEIIDYIPVRRNPIQNLLKYLVNKAKDLKEGRNV